MTDRSMPTAILVGERGIDDRIAGHWASPTSTAGAKDICFQYVDNQKKKKKKTPTLEWIPVSNVTTDYHHS